MFYLFWISLLALLYSYLGYLIVVAVCGAVADFKIRGNGISAAKGGVAIFVPAYNEERVIKVKLENLLSQDFDAYRLTIHVLSDGSTDGTDEIVRSFGDPRVILHSFPQRQGKTTCINEAIKNIECEIIVISDADVTLETSSLRKLLEPFSDPRVGVATGHRINSTAPRRGGGAGARMYWQYESALKSLESRLGKVIGSDGVFYAFRKELHRPFSPQRQDDLLMSLRAFNRGMKSVWVRDAICYEMPATSAREEFTRRSRTVARSLESFVFEGFSLIAPWKRPAEFMAFISHKVSRWMAPFFLIGLFAASFSLRDIPFYNAIFLAQALFYGIAIIGLLPLGLGLNTILQVPTFFVLSNIGLLAGWLKFASRRVDATWPTAQTMRTPRNDTAKRNGKSTLIALLSLALFFTCVVTYPAPRSDTLRICVPIVGAAFTSYKSGLNMTGVLLKQLNGREGLRLERIKKAQICPAPDDTEMKRLCGSRFELIKFAQTQGCCAVLEGNVVGDENNRILGLRVVNVGTRAVTMIRPVRLPDLKLPDADVIALLIRRAVEGNYPSAARLKVALPPPARSESALYLNGFQVDQPDKVLTALKGMNHILIYRKGYELINRWVDINEDDKEISFSNEVKQLSPPAWGSRRPVGNERLKFRISWNGIEIGDMQIHSSCSDDGKDCKDGYLFEVRKSIAVFKKYRQQGSALFRSGDYMVKFYSESVCDGDTMYSHEIKFDHESYTADYGSYRCYLRPFAFDPLSVINYIRSLPLKVGDRRVLWVHQNSENFPIQFTVQSSANQQLKLHFEAPQTGFMWDYVHEFEVEVEEKPPHLPLSFTYSSYKGSPVTGQLIGPE